MDRRYLAKAKRCISAHPKFRLSGVSPELLASDIEFARHRGCAYCGAPFAKLRDVTLDILGEYMPLGYPRNRAFCCQRCNSSKGGGTVQEWIDRRPVLAWAVADRRDLFLHLAGVHLPSEPTPGQAAMSGGGRRGPARRKPAANRRDDAPQ
jgi:hypothetical protein